MAKEITIKHLILSLDEALRLLNSDKDVGSGIRIVEAAKNILVDSVKNWNVAPEGLDPEALDPALDPEAPMFAGEPNAPLTQLDMDTQLQDVIQAKDLGDHLISRKHC